MSRFLCFLLLLGLAGAVGATRFTDCGSTTGKIISVALSGCPNNAPVCLMLSGSRASISIKFQANIATPVVEAEARGIRIPTRLTLPLPTNDGCSSGVTCPTVAGETYTYQVAFDLWRVPVPVPLNFTWKLKDLNGNNLVCASIKIIVQ